MSGRRPKFKINDMVKYDQVRTGVVVDWRARVSRPYRVVETLPDGSKPRGAPIWMKASDLEAVPGETRSLPAKIYRGNKKQGKPTECMCRIQHGEVVRSRQAIGFIPRAKGVAERAGWSFNFDRSDFIFLAPTDGRFSSPDSVRKGLYRAARIEDVNIEVTAMGRGGLSVLGDFSDAMPKVKAEEVSEEAGSDPADQLRAMQAKLEAEFDS